MSKIIVHIDLNYFFVRCEEIKDPSLEGKPVAVGHSGRAGIVSTCSYKAREYGVHSGMPMFKAIQKCPNLIIRPGDFEFYSVLSREFIMYVQTYTKKIEIASIDECYADFTDAMKGVKDPISYFRKFQRGLYNKTKLFCSIGIATNKFLAKMGSDYKKPHGITIFRNRDFKDKLYPIKISDMYGIGKKTAPRLENIGVYTIGDLAKRIENNDEDVKHLTGKFYYTLKEWVNGKGNDEIVNRSEEDSKSIGTSTTLLTNSDDYEEFRNVLKTLSKDVSKRAKQENKLGKTVILTMKDTNFVTQTKSMTMKNPTNNDNDIFDCCLDLLDKHYDGRLLRLVGVTLTNLVDYKDMVIQMTFFDFNEGEQEMSTKLLINDLNRRLSKPMLFRASEFESYKKRQN